MKTEEDEKNLGLAESLSSRAMLSTEGRATHSETQLDVVAASSRKAQCADPVNLHLNWHLGQSRTPLCQKDFLLD
jgi:hypothetical protein